MEESPAAVEEERSVVMGEEMGRWGSERRGAATEKYDGARSCSCATQVTC
jgi:hypothetical protein